MYCTYHAIILSQYTRLPCEWCDICILYMYSTRMSNHIICIHSYMPIHKSMFSLSQIFFCDRRQEPTFLNFAVDQYSAKI